MIRDFSNGFLVAEVLSRYFDKDVQMHSFDNGSSINSKKDNWNLLSLFLSKHDLPELCEKAEVSAIIHCETGVAVHYVCKLYEKLTKRR